MKKTKTNETKKNMGFNEEFFEQLKKTVDYTAHVAHEDDDIKTELTDLKCQKMTEMKCMWETHLSALDAFEKDKKIPHKTLAHLFAGINKVVSEKDMLGEGYKTYYVEVPTKKGWDYDVANDMFYLQNPQLSAQLYGYGLVFICAHEHGFILADKW